QAQGSPEPTLAAVPSTAAAVPATDWVFASLPAGFQLVQDLRQAATDGQPPLRQLILSDGMTSVSVFITPQGAQGVVDSLALSAGATKIYTANVAGHDVTLVGEVPVKTLKAIVENLQYVR
ncbi:MAG: MucB/RseB C-terminal domain-containing protein, partial [Thiothrix sp.]